jgi:hypothetical protein
MPDIFSYDVVGALNLPGCALCRALDTDDERWMRSFRRDGKQDPNARRRFFEAGGFCREHAWLVHRVVSEAGSAAAIADLYGQLATYDLRWLEKIRANLDRRRRQRAPTLRRRRRCPGCAFRADALDRKAHFLAEALSEEQVRGAYRRSEGLCFPHFARTLESALAVGNKEIAGFLLDDWRDRLAELRAELAEYDRKRDYRYASEPKGTEQRSWTEVVRRYVGEQVSQDPSRRP